MLSAFQAELYSSSTIPWWYQQKYVGAAAIANFRNNQYALPALGPELVQNGTFSPPALGQELLTNGSFGIGDSSGWNIQAAATISVAAGIVTITGNGTNQYPGISQTVSTVPGKTYAANYQWAVTASGSANPNIQIANKGAPFDGTNIIGTSGYLSSTQTTLIAGTTIYFQALGPVTTLSASSGSTNGANASFKMTGLSIKEVVLGSFGAEQALSNTFGTNLLTSSTWTTNLNGNTGTIAFSAGTLSFSIPSGPNSNSVNGSTPYLLSGAVYAITYTISNYTSGSVSWAANSNSGLNSGTGVSGITRNALGTYTEYVTPSVSMYFGFSTRSSAGATLSITNISVDQVYGPDGWVMSTTGGTAAASITPAGTLNLTGDGSYYAVGDQQFTTVIGQSYTLIQTVGATYTPTMIIGTSQGGSQIIGSTIVPAGVTSLYSFVATSAATWIRYAYNAAHTAVVSSISLRPFTSSLITNWTSGNQGVLTVSPTGYLQVGYNGTNSPLAFQALSFIPGKTYVVSAGFNKNTADSCTVVVGNSVGGNNIATSGIVSASGAITYYMTPLVSTGYLSLYDQSGGTNSVQFNNISVKEVLLGNYGAEQVVNGSNLLPQSQDFSQSPWAYTHATIASGITAPNGSPTAQALVDDTAISGHIATQAITPVAGQVYSYSIYMARGYLRYAMLQMSGGGLAQAQDVVIDFDNAGSLTTVVGSPVSVTSTAVGGGWYRVSFSATAISAALLAVAIYGNSDGTYAGRNYTGTGGNAVLIWHPQLEPFATVGTYIPTGAIAGGWVTSTSGGTATATNTPAGTLNLTGDGTQYGYGDQSFATIVGQSYTLICTSGGGTSVLRVSTTGGAAQDVMSAVLPVGTLLFSFVAMSTTTYVRFLNSAAATYTVSAISLRAWNPAPVLRSATFAEFFAYTAASTDARTLTTAAGLVQPISWGRTNLLQYSNDQSNAVWAYSTPLSTATPNIVTFAGGGNNDWRYQYITPSVGMTYTAQVMLSSGTKTGRIILSEYYSATRLVVNLTPTPTLYTITFVAVANMAIGLDNRAAVGGDNIAGTVNVSNFQLEPGPISTAYKPTTSTAVTAVNQPRLDYTNGVQQLALNDAGTNLALQSANVSISPWSTALSGGTISIPGTTGIAPDGTQTAQLVTVSRSTTSQGARLFQLFTGTAATWTGSFYVMAYGAGDVGKQVTINGYDGSASQGLANITLTSSWQRIQVSGTMTTSATCNFALGYYPHSVVLLALQTFWCGALSLN